MSAKQNKSYEDLVTETEELRAQLAEAQEVLRVIRTGSVDALTVERWKGEQISTFQGNDHPCRLSIEHMNEGAVTVDQDGLVTYANWMFADLVGLPLAQIFGRQLSSFVSEADRPLCEDLIQKANGDGSRLELALLSDGGGLIPVLLSVHQLPVEPDRFYCCIVSDLRRQGLHEQLRQSVERLRLATTAAAVGIWEWNVKTNRIRWDAQMFRIYGAAPTADGCVPYETWSHAVVPEDLSEQERVLWQTVRRCGSSSRTFRIRRYRDGEERHIEAVEITRTDAHGQTEWVIGTNIDITERRRVQMKLTQSEERFRTMAEAVPSFLFETDAAGWNTWTSESWCRFTGQTTEQVSGHGWAEALHPEDRAANLGQWLHCMEHGLPFESQQRLRRTDGTYAWVIARALPVRDEHGTICRWLGSVTDVDTIVRVQDSLRESESRLLRAQRSARAGVWDIDLLTKKVQWSEPHHELYGFTSDVTPSHENWIAGVHPEDRARVEAQFALAVLARGAQSIEFRINRDGEIRWLHSEGHVTCDAEGRPIRVAGITWDITERKQAEAALQERNRQLELLAWTSQRLLLGREPEQELLEAIFEGIARLTDMEMFYYHRPSEDPKRFQLHMSGSIIENKQDRFAGMKLSDHLCDRVVERRERLIIEDLQHSSHSGNDVQKVAGATSYAGFPLVANGELLGTIAFISNRRTHLCEGDVQMIQSICDQIAAWLERMQLQRELHEREKRLTLAADVGQLGSWDWDVLTDRVEWSSGHFELLGLRPGDVQPSYEAWASHVHPDDLPEVEQNLRKSMASHAEYRADFRVIWADGSIHWMAGRGRFQYAVDGRCIRMVGVMVDITHRKQTETALCEKEERTREFAAQLERLVAERTKELLQSQDRLRALATELNLAEQRERKRLATELHDYLAQLLAVGKMSLDRIKQQIGAPVVEELDGTLDEALRYTRTLVAQLSPPFFHELGLPYAFRWLAEQMEPRGLRFTVEVQDGFPSLLEDHATLLFQAARELLLNALKHAETDQARLAMTAAEETIRIEVSDNGRGFDVAALESPSAGATRMRFGLFSIRERMIAMGGRFELLSRPGEGTRATLVAPLNTSAVTRLETSGVSHHVSDIRACSNHSVLNTQNSAPSSTKIRVLLVDDHAMVRQGLRSILEAYADVEVVGEAAAGDEAVALVDQLRPSVVVMDINMPRMNGIQATAAIKARHSAVVVIGLSVQAEALSRSEMLRAGATTLVTKEVAVEELYRTIQDVLREHTPH